MSIRHRKITPLWPAANAQVERFNETLEKNIQISNVEGKNWRSELFVFLMNYRNTPHCSTGVSPASLMIKRHLATSEPRSHNWISLVLQTSFKAHAQMTIGESQRQRNTWTNDTRRVLPIFARGIKYCYFRNVQTS